MRFIRITLTKKKREATKSPSIHLISYRLVAIASFFNFWDANSSVVFISPNVIGMSADIEDVLAASSKELEHVIRSSVIGADGGSRGVVRIEVEVVLSSDALSDAQMAQYTGEAKFFRACFYSYLIALFGDVPFYTDYITLEEAYEMGRIDREVVLGHIYEDFDAFKLYTLDVGLLGAMTNAPATLMLVSNDVFKEYKGAFSENYVLQQLKTFDDLDICYFSKDNSTQEIDFLVQTSKRIIPIEVKAEENVKSKSLSQFIRVDYADKQLKGLRCSMKPYIDQEWMENIPLYAILGFMGKETN